ncbi:NAD-dependent protein deacylase [Bacillus benzoevorans]|uniref:protein acetyllysine N-acetyltransferase n=1 Tax=Bacillus benzoevorans TaxID=1456 RepID=A0A7X0HQ43_9BACI|nr:NAD-dependent protein deacylase [Bacillus benzoevorans]MBB6444813.1 NAD-dependent deacetylase [Bacillus benzoevorans]
MNQDMIATCTNFIRNARNIVVLTGAGISTESGIKDFRSSKGIYTLAPEYVLSLDYFYEYPNEFYQFALEHLYHPEALPNKGHEILAKWERAGKVSHIITQNIDGLHQMAGSKNVIEFHGTIATAACLHCGRSYTTEEMVHRGKKMEEFYICHECNTHHVEDRYIKPDVVLYGDAGEWFTQKGFETILNMIFEADCILVLGSSLKVTPFSTFPQHRKNAAPMIIVNIGETPYDHSADTFCINDSIGKVLEEMDKIL